MSTIETDMSLLHRFAKAGDQTAFAEIIHRYAGVVFAACHRVLGDATRAEDVSQETFFRLMRKPQAVTQSLGAWLHTAATNLAVDALRSESARRKRERGYGEELLRAQPVETVGGGIGGDSWADLSPQVDAALAELPEEFRLLLIAHFLQGRPQNELAMEAKTSAATMSRRIRAAIEALQQKLRGKGFSIAPLALTGLLHDHALQAVPTSLAAQLGKMTMVSGAGAMLASTAISSTTSLLRTAVWILAASMAFGALVALIGGHFARHRSSAAVETPMIL
jgi:RNA polymerase sigma factor (sigma-70 family)